MDVVIIVIYTNLEQALMFRKRPRLKIVIDKVKQNPKENKTAKRYKNSKPKLINSNKYLLYFN